MNEIRLHALALAPELALSQLARHFDIARRFTWEEPLELSGAALRRAWPEAGEQRVFLFAFGAAVFIDCDERQIRNLVDYLGKLQADISTHPVFQWSDQYTLTLVPGTSPHCDAEGVTLPALSRNSMLVLSTVLAKSVSLERVEAALETALDHSEKRIAALEQGRLRGADAHLARDAGAVLRLEHESIHYLGLPDKPECTWTDEEADALYTLLARQFELRDRYTAVRNRIDVLKDLGGTFASLAHAHRAARLEWIIILLIAFEIVLPAVQYLWRLLSPATG